MLLIIFPVLGPPDILQSDNGGEFSNIARSSKTICFAEDELQTIINYFYQLWPGMKQITGTPRHSQSNGGVETHNKTMEGKVNNWMLEYDSTAWSIGSKFVNWKTNTQIIRSLGNKSPCELLTGQKPNQGLSALPIHPDLLAKLQKESHLHSLLMLPDDAPVEKALVTSNLNTEIETVGNSLPNVEEEALTIMEEEAIDANEENDAEITSHDSSYHAKRADFDLLRKFQEENIGSESDYSSISDHEVGTMLKWNGYANNDLIGPFEFTHPKVYFDNKITPTNSPRRGRMNDASIEPIVEDKEPTSTSATSSIQQHLSHHNNSNDMIRNSTAWLDLC